MSAIIPQKILEYLNQARTKPLTFCEYIKKEIDSFVDNQKMPLKPNFYYATNEGKQVWLQAYDFVKSHKPLQPFKLNAGLSLAAQDHALDMKNNSFFDHSSSDGSSFTKRIQRRCGKAFGASAQCLGSQFDIQGRNHALQTVLGLIIDDGVPNRGHRKSIFSDTYKFVGIYSVKSNDKIVTVIDFHSEDLKVINDKKINVEQPKKQIIKKQQFNDNKDIQKKFANMNISKENNGERYAVSTSTSTKTSTVNGVTKKVVTKKTKYSNGDQEQEINQTIG